MLVKVECEYCKYNFDFYFGFGGISMYTPYRCNECRRYFIARTTFDRASNQPPFKDIKAIAVKWDDEERAAVYEPKWIYCKECGNYNIEEIKYEDVVGRGKIRIGQKAKVPCLICGRKLKYLGCGPFDG